MSPPLSISGSDFDIPYQGMRVDYLHPVELDYEPLHGNVTIADDDQDPEIDLVDCRHLDRELARLLATTSRTEAAVCKPDLLHLGHRPTVLLNHSIDEIRVQALDEFKVILELFPEHLWSGGAVFAETGIRIKKNLSDQASGGFGYSQILELRRLTASIPRFTQHVTKDTFFKSIIDIKGRIKAPVTQVNGLHEESRAKSSNIRIQSVDITNPIRYPIFKISQDFQPFHNDKTPDGIAKTPDAVKSTRVSDEELNSSFHRRFNNTSVTSSVSGFL